MWRNYHRIIQAAIARSHHEPNPSKTGKAYRHFAVVGAQTGFNSTPISRNSIKARHCHAEQDVLRKLSPGKYDSLFVGRLASDFNEENLKFGNSKPCTECVDRIKNARNDGILIKKVIWTNGEGGIDISSVDKLESDHMTLHQRTQMAENSACCLHNNHHHHDDDDDDEDDEDDDEDKEGQKSNLNKERDKEKYIESDKEKYIESDNEFKNNKYNDMAFNELNQFNEFQQNPNRNPFYQYKILIFLGTTMLVPYMTLMNIIDVI